MMTTLTMLWRNSLSITGQRHEKLHYVHFAFYDNCQINVSVRLLTIKIRQWARENLCCYRKNFVCSCNVFLPKCNQSISSPCVLVYVTERRWSNLTCHTVHIASVQEARGIKVGNWVSRDSWREGKQGNWKHATAEKMTWMKIRSFIPPRPSCLAKFSHRNCCVS